jgi:hypothetical protein
MREARRGFAEVTAAPGVSPTEGGIPQPHGDQAVRASLTTVIARMQDLPAWAGGAN